MSPQKRLSDHTLASVGRGIGIPAYDRARVTVGIVHFGPGAFHRVHQAYYVDRVLDFDARWGICGVSLKHKALRDALTPQNGLYTLTTLEKDLQTRVVGALKEALFAQEDGEVVRARLAAPSTRIVTLTVTEKGYCFGSDGTLDFEHPDIRHDLGTPSAPRSVIGWIVEGLRVRHASNLRPFTTISCDNLPDNGTKLKGAVIALAAARDGALASWIERAACFPNTMVDSHHAGDRRDSQGEHRPGARSRRCLAGAKGVFRAVGDRGLV